MLGRLQLPRPGLPAICVSDNSATISAIALDAGPGQIYANQISALGQQNDVLFSICSGGNDDSLLAATAVAHDRDMSVICLTGESGDELSEALHPADIEITVPAENSLRIHEIQVLALHCICDLIDNQLMGS
jgi:D-sedoheptulose 7-phosphate isomerase